MYTDDDGKLINNLLTFWNIDIVKCYKKVYNNIKEVQKLPKTVRWGAILYTNINDIDDIEKMIGDDLLTMEEKEKLINRINEVKNNKQIIQEWMVIENNRIREENILRTAREDGLKEGIEQGIEQGTHQGEEKKELELIKKMLSKKTNYEFISDITGKTIEEIKEIEANI